MEFEKNRIIMEKSWNFGKYYGKTTTCQKTSCRPTASFLATGGIQVLIISKCMHGLQACFFAAFRIYAQRGEVAAKRGGWSLYIK